MDAVGHSLITAYALQRPDGQWSLMLVNRDQENAHKVQIVFEEGGNVRTFTGAVNIATFGSGQYQWQPARGVPDPDGPVSKSSATASTDTWYELPKASMTVIRGSLASPAGKAKTH